MFLYQLRACAGPFDLRHNANEELGQDDDLLLDAPEATLMEVQPAAGEDTEMTVDEEGRPRFAPAKNTVRSLPDATALPRYYANTKTTTGWSDSSRDKKSSHTTSSNVTAQGFVASNISSFG